MKKSKVYIKICQNCGEEFTAHDCRSKFCSHSCRTQAYNKRISEGIHIAEVQRKVKAYALAQLEEKKRAEQVKADALAEKERKIRAFEKMSTSEQLQSIAIGVAGIAVAKIVENIINKNR